MGEFTSALLGKLHAALTALARGADIALVRPHRCLLAMQELIPDLAVMNLRRRGREAVHDAALGIDADVRFHPEEPVIPLLRRRHLWIAGLGLVLGRRRRVDDRRIHERARAQGDPLIGKMLVHLDEQPLRQRMLLQQVSEVQDRRLVRYAVITELNACEPAHGLAVVKHFLGHGIAQRIPLLEKVDPQHRLHRHGRTPSARAPLRVMRLDQSQQPRPWHHRFHLGQELLATRPLLLHRVAEAGKDWLLGHRRASLFVPLSLSQHAQSARFFRLSTSWRCCPETPLGAKAENCPGEARHGKSGDQMPDGDHRLLDGSATFVSMAAAIPRTSLA